MTSVEEQIDGMYEVPGSRLRELRDAERERDTARAVIADNDRLFAGVAAERDRYRAILEDIWAEAADGGENALTRIEGWAANALGEKRGHDA